MTLPGWESLDSVKTIDSMVQIVTLGFWSLLVVFEAIAVVWKKRATQFTILALCAFALAVGGEIVHYQYDSRKEVLYGEQIDALKKINTPRTLTQDQKQKFLAIMSTGKSHDITVWHAPDLESQNYADQLSNALREAGWPVKPAPFRMLERSAPGLVIMVHDVKVAEPEAVVLQSALSSAGIETNAAGVESIVAAGQIELWVGPKNAITSSSN
jgi:hypothetical protein